MGDFSSLGIEINTWRKIVQDCVRWRKIVQAAITHLELYRRKMKSQLTILSNLSFMGVFEIECVPIQTVRIKKQH